MSKLPPLPRQFTADMIRSDGEGTRFHVDGKWERQEDLTGRMRTLIVNPVKRTIYSVDDDGQTYFATKYSKKEFDAEALDTDDMCDWELKGRKRITGRVCLKYVGKYRGEFSDDAEKECEVCYVDFRTKMRRRLETFDRRGKLALRIDYVNVVLGRPKRKVFEIPKGFKKER